MEPTWLEPTHVASTHVASSHVEPTRVEPTWVEPTLVEPKSIMFYFNFSGFNYFYRGYEDREPFRSELDNMVTKGQNPFSFVTGVSVKVS